MLCLSRLLQQKDPDTYTNTTSMCTHKPYLCHTLRITGPGTDAISELLVKTDLC